MATIEVRITHRLKLLLYSLAAVFLTACVTNRNTARVVSLHEEYDIVMEHAYHRDCPYYGLSSHYYDGGCLVAEGVKWTSQQYLKYNVSDSVLLDSVSLMVRPNIRIDGYCFLDKNTVLVAANPSYERDLHDGIFIVLSKIPVYLDTTNEYRYYFNEWVNLRCIELDSGTGTIIFDKIINPSNLMDLDDFLKEEE